MGKAATATATKSNAGRKPSEFEGRFAIRRHDEQEEAWRLAAALCGMQLADWVREVLEGETKKPIHVKPLGKR